MTIQKYYQLKFIFSKTRQILAFVKIFEFDRPIQSLNVYNCNKNYHQRSTEKKQPNKT